MLQTDWYEVRPGNLPRGVVVVEATATARALWDGPVASVLEALADLLPPDAWPDVVPLGGRQTYPLAAVLAGLGSAHPVATPGGFRLADELGRYPVAGPILADLAAGAARPVVFLLTGPTLDLDDWAGTESGGQVLIYRVLGPGRVTSPTFREVGPDTDPAAVADHLRDPATAIRVGGGAALIVGWADPVTRSAHGEVTLTGPFANPLRVRVAHPTDQRPEARVSRRGGAVHSVRLIRSTAPPPTPAVMLSPGEGTVLDLWRRGSAYFCSACSRNHPPGQLPCSTGNGPGLLPTVAALPRSAVCALTPGPGSWSATAVPGLAELADGRWLDAIERRAAVYEFADGRWVETAVEGGLYPGPDGQFVVVR